jgi:hypothetical protein
MPDEKREGTTDQNPGFWTGEQLKTDFAKALQDALNNQNLMYYVNCVTANPYINADVASKKTKEELHSQLHRSKYVKNHRTIDIGVPKTSWSGKTGANGKLSAGINDDMVVMLAAGIYWVKRVYLSPRPYPTLPLK